MGALEIRSYMSLGMTEALIVLGIVVLLFGGKKIPELGRALGQSLGNFKKGLREERPKESQDDDSSKDNQ